MSSLLCVSSNSTPCNGREASKQASSLTASRCKVVPSKNKKKLFGTVPVIMASKDASSSDSKTVVVAASRRRSSRVNLFFKKLRSLLRGRKQLAITARSNDGGSNSSPSARPGDEGNARVEAVESAVNTTTAPPAPAASGLDNIDQNHNDGNEGEGLSETRTESAAVSLDLRGHFGGEDSHHDGGKVEPTPEEESEDVDDDDDDDDHVPSSSERKESFSYALEELEWGPEPVLEEWTIQSRELVHNRVVSSTKDETVYNGYWHGSVLVHCRSTGDRESVENFVSEVNTLCCIRHENIQLFLGVCFDYRKNYMSIVMDQKKGDSLHTLLHKHGHQFSNHSSMKILNQVAQGMEYLHSKGIPHHLLTSKSISVHRRACISMLSPHCPNGSVLPEHLPYLPPEVVRTLCVEVNNNDCSESSSRLSAKETAAELNYCSPFAANVFSFGTLVYELALNELPHAREAITSVIWRVGSGGSQSMSRSIQHSSKLREIVHNCWSGNPNARPSFDELTSQLSYNTAHMSPRSPLLGRLHSPFSFSEPFRMANINFGR